MHTTREAWLCAAAELMVPRFSAQGKPLPPVRLSIGFPATGGLSARSRTIGQCWANTHAKDGAHHIFINPTICDDPAKVLEVLSHELCHAAVGCEHGHKKPFAELARALGHEGKMTATVAGERLKPFITEYMDKLGPYPGSGLTIEAKRRKQTTRLRLYECPGCGLKARISADGARLECMDCETRLVQAAAKE